MSDTGTSRIHTIGTPIQVYPLFEAGYRAHGHQSFEENLQESAALYGEFAKVAEKHPKAWSYGEKTETAETIGSVSSRNRMVYLPCKETILCNVRESADIQFRPSPDDRDAVR